MTHLVLECHPAYAVVLDEEGRFARVPNLGYEVGQVLEDAVIFDDDVLTFDVAATRRRRGRLVAVLSAAACLCALFIGGFALWQTPFGTVHMRINPEVSIDVNRFDRVVDIDGENDEGKDLVEDLAYYGRTIDEVSDDVAQRAEDQGYLGPGNTIELTVESDDEQWRTATEDRLIVQLEVHLEDPVIVTEPIRYEIEVPVQVIEEPAEQPAPAPEAQSAPVSQPAPAPSDDGDSGYGAGGDSGYDSDDGDSGYDD